MVPTRNRRLNRKSKLVGAIKSFVESPVLVSYPMKTEGVIPARVELAVEQFQAFQPGRGRLILRPAS